MGASKYDERAYPSDHKAEHRLQKENQQLRKENEALRLQLKNACDEIRALKGEGQ